MHLIRFLLDSRQILRRIGQNAGCNMSQSPMNTGIETNSKLWGAILTNRAWSIGQNAGCIFYLTHSSVSLSLKDNIKHNRALLGSNSARNRIAKNKKQREIGSIALLPFLLFNLPYAKKNPFINRLRFSSGMPLWTLRFFLMSVNFYS